MISRYAFIVVKIVYDEYLWNIMHSEASALSPGYPSQLLLDALFLSTWTVLLTVSAPGPPWALQLMILSQQHPHPLSLHSEINTLHDRALDLACSTKTLLDDAAGPLLAQLSPAGYLIQAESWQGQEGELAKHLVFHLNLSIIIS